MNELEGQLQELFDICWELNKSENTRTALTQKVTTYLPGIMQEFGAMRVAIEGPAHMDTPPFDITPKDDIKSTSATVERFLAEAEQFMDVKDSYRDSINKLISIACKSDKLCSEAENTAVSARS